MHIPQKEDGSLTGVQRLDYNTHAVLPLSRIIPKHRLTLATASGSAMLAQHSIQQRIYAKA